MNRRENILVFDLGTTNFKASVFDENATLLALTAIPTPITSTESDRSEIELSAFQSAIARLLKELAEKLPQGLTDITAVSFATQTNSFVLLDEQDTPLTPLILWNDRRAVSMEDALTPIKDLTGYYNTTGVPELSTEFMLAKLLWLRREQPDLFSRTRRLCLISDYLTYWMTGCHVTEAGAAGLTGMMDIHRLTWWPEVLQTVGLDPDMLPEIQRTGKDLGVLRPEIAASFSLPSDCRFILGCLDQYAGAIGSGNVLPGIVSETTGTVLATVRCTDTPAFTPESSIFIGSACREGRYYQMTFGDVSANLLEAYRNQLAHRPDFSELVTSAAQVTSEVSLPEDDDSQLLQNWIKDNAKIYSEGEMTRAIMERVAFALRKQVKTLCKEQDPDKILCVGGAARSALWLQIKADVLNIPTIPINCPEPTSLGAALLAIHAVSGIALEVLTDKLIPYGKAMSPDVDRHAHYQKMMQP